MVNFRLGPGALFSLLFLVFFGPSVAASLVNRTIDDSFGDSQTGLHVTYYPATGFWKDQSCSDCNIIPNISETFKGTYTATDTDPRFIPSSITMKFNGTAIYVFFVLLGHQTVARFTVDGKGTETFSHYPDDGPGGFQYNELVFSRTVLINAEHTLEVSFPPNTYANFDYAIYTYDDEDPPHQSPSAASSSLSASKTEGSTTFSQFFLSPTQTVTISQADSHSSDRKSTSAGVILGSVVGGLTILAILTGLVLCHVQERRKRRANGRFVANGLYTPTLMPEFGSRIGSHNPLHNAVVPLLQMSRSESGNNHSPSSSTHSDTPYDACLSPVSNSVRKGRIRSDTIPTNSGAAYVAKKTQRPLRLVTEPDHPSSAGGDSNAAFSNRDNIETIRRSRQNEINLRLKFVKKMLDFLEFDISGEKGGRLVSVKRQRIVFRQGESGVLGAGDEAITSMAEMENQLRLLQEQFEFLRKHQRSAWAQGLSNDPPPGYTLSSPV